MKIDVKIRRDVVKSTMFNYSICLDLLTKDIVIVIIQNPLISTTLHDYSTHPTLKEKYIQAYKIYMKKIKLGFDLQDKKIALMMLPFLS